jgi:hypothetical protein
MFFYISEEFQLFWQQIKVLTYEKFRMNPVSTLRHIRTVLYVFTGIGYNDAFGFFTQVA